MKYNRILKALDDDELYSPAAIATIAMEKGFPELGETPEEAELIRQPCRIAMGRFTNNHCFPDEGDGQITLSGQSPTPAWFGQRYKQVLILKKL